MLNITLSLRKNIYLRVSEEGIFLSSVIKDKFVFRIPRPAGNYIHHWLMVFKETFWENVSNILRYNSSYDQQYLQYIRSKHGSQTTDNWI